MYVNQLVGAIMVLYSANLSQALLLGFSFFNSTNTVQGLQNQMFGVFLFLFIYIQIIQQMMPMFVTQRALYEARERQSKTYCWQSFILSNLFAELAWNTVSRSIRSSQIK